MKNLTKKEKIKRHLLSGKTLTVAQCMRLYKTHKLSARVQELNEEGMRIVCDMKRNKKTKESYGVYKIKKK